MKETIMYKGYAIYEWGKGSFRIWNKNCFRVGITKTLDEAKKLIDELTQ